MELLIATVKPNLHFWNKLYCGNKYFIYCLILLANIHFRNFAIVHGRVQTIIFLSFIVLVWLKCMHAQLLSLVWLFATPWTVACHTPLFMEFSKQEYWNGLPFLTPGALCNPGIEPVLAGRFFTTVPPRSQGKISHIFLFSESFYKIGNICNWVALL